MKTKEIVEAVEKYISDENAQYALLIDGTWGSGKTYLYEKYLIDAINSRELGKGKCRKNVYISLYGVSNMESLAKLLITNYLVYGIGKGNNLVKKGIDPVTGIIGTTASALTFSIGPVSANLSKSIDKIEELIKKIKVKDLIICFDDLERCTIPINEFFGCVNNLVEHCNCKVLILADEGNIGKIYANTNIEAKYLTVLSGSRLILDRREDGAIKKSQVNGSNKNGYEITVDELKKINEKLYSENYIYKDIKEKVIGKTLYYYPDLGEVICELINSDCIILGEQYKNFILNHLKEICSIFGETYNRNIRTIKLWLISFKKIYDVTTKYYSENMYYETMMEDFLRYSIWVWVSVKNNKKILQKSNYIKESQVYLEGNEYRYTRSYNFIDAWIQRDAWNDEELSKECKSIISRNEREESINPPRIESSGEAFGRLKEWPYMEDEQVEKGLDNLKKELKENKYAFYDYSKILLLLLNLEEAELTTLECINYIQKTMIDLINMDKIIQDEEEPFLNFPNEEMRQKFRKFYTPIEEERKKRNREINKEEQEEGSIYRSAEAFFEHCVIKENYYFVQKTFVGFLDFEKLYALINESDNEGLYTICRAFNKVYNMGNLKEYYWADADELIKFRRNLTDNKIVNQGGKTRQLALRNFAERIKYFLTLLGVDEVQM